MGYTLLHTDLFNRKRFH